MNEWDKVSLNNLSGGAACELWDGALQEVIANMLDINTDPSKAREIQLCVRFAADKNDRKKVSYGIQVKTKLAPPLPVGNIMYVGHELGELAAYEQVINQGNLFKDESEDGKIVTLKQNQEGVR